MATVWEQHPAVPGDGTIGLWRSSPAGVELPGFAVGRADQVILLVAPPSRLGDPPQKNTQSFVQLKLLRAAAVGVP